MSEVCPSVVCSHTEDGLRQILAACYLVISLVAALGGDHFL